MKPQNITCIWLLTLVLASGCTLEVSDSSTGKAITEADLLAARQIIGGAVSSDNSGVVLSINDALTIIAQTGGNSTSPNTLRKDRSGLGTELNLQTGFNQQSGIFAVSFQRKVQGPLFNKKIASKLTYLYKDGSGNIITNPNQNAGLITSVDYTAHRDGDVQSLREQSSFISDDSLFISGFKKGASKSVDGIHTSGGSTQLKTLTGNTIQRFYDLRIRFLNITSPKQLSTSGQTTNIALNGNMGFELELRSTNGSSTNRTTISGTLEHNGDGTALLRFQNRPELYLIDLKNGETVSLNDAFMGQILSVDLNQQSISLASGITIYINKQTTFESTTLNSLQSVQNILTENESIVTEGEGRVENSRFTASSITFEVEQPQFVNQGELIEFEEVVTSADTSKISFNLAGQVPVQLEGNIQISDNGDYSSLNQLVSALQQGVTVIAEGKAMPSNDRLFMPKTEKVTFKDIGNSN